MEPKLVMYQEIPYEVIFDDSLQRLITIPVCPFMLRLHPLHVGSFGCHKYCKFFYGIDKEKKIVKCTHKVEE